MGFHVPCTDPASTGLRSFSARAIASSKLGTVPGASDATRGYLVRQPDSSGICKCLRQGKAAVSDIGEYCAPECSSGDQLGRGDKGDINEVFNTTAADGTSAALMRADDRAAFVCHMIGYRKRSITRPDQTRDIDRRERLDQVGWPAHGRADNDIDMEDGKGGGGAVLSRARSAPAPLSTHWSASAEVNSRASARSYANWRCNSTTV